MENFAVFEQWEEKSKSRSVWRHLQPCNADRREAEELCEPGHFPDPQAGDF